MQAIVMNQPGGPEVLEPRSLPLPERSAARHVRVRLHAAGVNPVDTKLRANGTYYPDRLPTILGCDGAGGVEAVGDQVTRVQPGDKVYYCSGGGGGVQLARDPLARVAATVGDADKAAFVRALGAEHIIEYKQQDFVQAALDWTGGAGVDLTLDTVGGEP